MNYFPVLIARFISKKRVYRTHIACPRFLKFEFLRMDDSSPVNSYFLHHKSYFYVYFINLSKVIFLYFVFTKIYSRTMIHHRHFVFLKKDQCTISNQFYNSIDKCNVKCFYLIINYHRTFRAVFLENAKRGRTICVL